MTIVIAVLLLANRFYITTATSFLFPPGQPFIYNGYICKDAEKVHLSPRLQAAPDYLTSTSGKLCGIRVYNSDGSPSRIAVTVMDPIRGLADILVNEDSGLNFEQGGTTVFNMEAYDCDNPPNMSERVPLSIHVVKEDGLFFTQSSHDFTISENSPIGSVVGPVQAIRQLKRNEDPMLSAVCAYHLCPSDTPFTIDKYGVLRVKRKLQPRKDNQPYTVQVVAEDCHRPVPRTASVNVIVKQITNGCQPGWTGLPNYLEFDEQPDRPKKIFKFHNMQLNMCADICAEQEEVRVRLELRSAMKGYTLKTATSEACSHDPESLSRQRTLCDVNPNTLKDLLPDPAADLVSQLVGPFFGNPPTLVTHSMSWRFDSQSFTVWEIDPKYLNNGDIVNAFDTDFTLTFWIRRFAGSPHSKETYSEDKEEAILCSQDHQEANWRFFSVSVKNCFLVIRLLTSWKDNTDGLGAESHKPTIWTIGSIPSEYCVLNEANSMNWHHYTVTFNRAAWGSKSEPVSLLIDGQDFGASDSITTTLLPAIPPSTLMERTAKPKITVGACYDPATHLTAQHLNAELSGVTLLLGETEAPNNLRCMAQCGESLLVPNVMKHLQSNLNVRLESDAVTITGRSVSHVIEVLQEIAYVRPRPDVSPDYTPHATQTRLLNLSTTYKCPDSAEITLPHTEIQLNLLPQLRDDGKLVETDASVDNQHRSVWVDEASYPHPVERTIREHRAMGQSLSEEPGDEPPILMIQGSDVIITEPSIGEEGIPLFPDLEFQLPEQEMRAGSNAQLHAAAAAVPLEDCLVWIVSTEDLLNSSRGTDLHQSEDERIDWPVDLVVQLGLSGTNDKHGVKLHGRKPAGYYESLLRTFHYFPPREIRTSDEANKPDPREANVRYVATVGLMCSTDAGQHMTNQFSVKVVLESPEYIEQDLSGNRAIQKLSPKTIDATPIRTQLNKGHRPRRNGSRTIREAELQNVPPVRPETRSHVSSVVVGTLVVVSATLVLLTVVLVVFVRKKTWRRKVRSSDSVEHPRRRRFPSKPADFGGSSLKFDPTLRLTANPIGEMEYVGLGTVKENMYGSSRDLAATQCIFSPPSMDTYSEEGIVRLAGLEEFDEDYADEASEELYNEDISQDHVQELNDGEVLQNSTDCSELENSTHEDGLTPRCSTDLEASQTQVHDWPEEQEAATDRMPFVADPNKC